MIYKIRIKNKRSNQNIYSKIVPLVGTSSGFSSSDSLSEDLLQRVIISVSATNKKEKKKERETYWMDQRWYIQTTETASQEIQNLNPRNIIVFANK